MTWPRRRVPPPGAARPPARRGDARGRAARAAGGLARGPRRRRSAAGRSQPPLRYVARFSVTGRGRFLGHLDRMEIFRRAVRRAGGRLGALRAGCGRSRSSAWRCPWGWGWKAWQELCEFELADEPAVRLPSDRLEAALPGHMRLLTLRALPCGAPAGRPGDAGLVPRSWSPPLPGPDDRGPRRRTSSRRSRRRPG